MLTTSRFAVHPPLVVSLLVVCAALPGCQRDAAPPAASAVPADLARAEVAALPVHLDLALGSDLRLAGLSVAPRPDGKSWEVTLYSQVLHTQNPRPQLWLHAYPPESHEYRIVEPTGNFPTADAGGVVKDGFLLTSPGAFNLYAGVMGTGENYYGPAVSIGWVAVGAPASPEFQAALQFLRTADDSRTAAMRAMALRANPSAAARNSATR